MLNHCWLILRKLRIKIRGLDTYYGRHIVRIDKDSDGKWFIELEGEVRIINDDKAFLIPDFPNGGSGFLYTNLIMEQDQTQMVFQDGAGAQWRAVFNPLKYQIFDQETSPTAWNPQSGGYAVQIPEPRARLAEGPEKQVEEPDEE